MEAGLVQFADGEAHDAQTRVGAGPLVSVAGYPASRFAAVISAGTASGVGTDVADAAADGIGNVYVDDETETPTYATLPAFWSTEVSDVQAEP
jgi:hypothetical protein